MSHAIVLVAVECQRAGIEKAVAHQMEPFDENGEWFKNGSRWDYFQIGGRYSGRLMGKDFAKVGDVPLEKFQAWREKSARKSFQECLEDKETPAEIRQMVWGIEPDETADSYAAKRRNIFFPAFLRDRAWHENERLGWFGSTIKSECEIGRTEVLKGKCLVQDKKTGAKIVGWNDGRWEAKYWDRFIKPLSPETFLVVVDYHV